LLYSGKRKNENACTPEIKIEHLAEAIQYRSWIEKAGRGRIVGQRPTITEGEKKLIWYLQKLS
jgi:hypothetical protein